MPENYWLTVSTVFGKAVENGQAQCPSDNTSLKRGVNDSYVPDTHAASLLKFPISF
jgi:hypothetical protein